MAATKISLEQKTTAAYRVVGDWIESTTNTARFAKRLAETSPVGFIRLQKLSGFLDDLNGNRIYDSLRVTIKDYDEEKWISENAVQDVRRLAMDIVKNRFAFVAEKSAMLKTIEENREFIRN